MELYLGTDRITALAKVADLESALTAVRCLRGRKELGLLAPDGQGLVLSMRTRWFQRSEQFLVEHVRGNCVAQLFTPSFKHAGDCARRFLAGRMPFPGALTEDGCPLCRLGH